jgi:hypothetical protein
LVSSAYKLTPAEMDMLSGKSLMYTEKRKGVSNEPCGTPDVIGKGVDVRREQLPVDSDLTDSFQTTTREGQIDRNRDVFVTVWRFNGIESLGNVHEDNVSL